MIGKVIIYCSSGFYTAIIKNKNPRVHNSNFPVYARLSALFRIFFNIVYIILAIIKV